MKIFYYNLKDPNIIIKGLSYKTTNGIGSFKNHMRGFAANEYRYDPVFVGESLDDRGGYGYSFLTDTQIVRILNYILDNLNIFEHDTITHVTRKLTLSIEKDNKTWKEKYESI